MASPVKERTQAARNMRTSETVEYTPPSIPDGFQLRSFVFLTRHGDRTPAYMKLGGTSTKERAFWTERLPTNQVLASWDRVLPHRPNLAYPDPVSVAITGSDAKAYEGVEQPIQSSHDQLNGQLTSRGAAQLRSSGKALAKAYGHLWDGKVKYSDLYVRSTHYPRVIRSCQNLLLGFLGAETQEDGTVSELEVLGSIPSCSVEVGDPLTTQWEHPQSKMYAPRMASIFKDSITEAMRQSFDENEENGESSHVKKIREEAGDFRDVRRELVKAAQEEIAKRAEGECLLEDNKQLFNEEGDKMEWDMLIESQNLWDEFHCRRHHGRDVPMKLTDRHQSTIETAWSLAYDTPEARKLGMGRLLREIEVHISGIPDAKGKRLPKPKNRGVIFAGHDATIMPLLSYFDAFDGRWPLFASTVTIEVLEKKESENEKKEKDEDFTPIENVFIRLLRNDKVLRLPALEALEPSKDGVYSFAIFRDYIREHSYDREIDYVLHAHSTK